MAAMISKEELRKLLPVNARHGGTVVLFSKAMPWEPVSVGHYSRYVLARFESAQALYVVGAQRAAAEAETALAAKEERDPDPRIVNAVDMRAYTVAQARDAGAANCAMVACGIGHAGDEEIEAWLDGADDAELYAALEAIEEGTWGADPAGFFARVGRTSTGRAIPAMIRAAQAKGAASTSGTDTSIPTPSKARKPRLPTTTAAPNRKSRRTAASRAKRA